MIRHIVLFKMKPELDGKKEELANGLRGLKEKIDCIKKLEVGIDVIGTPKSFDLGINSVFENRAALDTYLEHPDHVRVVEKIKEWCSDIVKVDYEI